MSDGLFWELKFLCLCVVPGELLERSDLAMSTSDNSHFYLCSSLLALRA